MCHYILSNNYSEYAPVVDEVNLGIAIKQKLSQKQAFKSLCFDRDNRE